LLLLELRWYPMGFLSKSQLRRHRRPPATKGTLFQFSEPPVLAATGIHSLPLGFLLHRMKTSLKPGKKDHNLLLAKQHRVVWSVWSPAQSSHGCHPVLA
jgi:hypothetical protein